MELTRFQARYIQWLTLIGYSQRATAREFFNRYNEDDLSLRVPKGKEEIGNQMSGIFLRQHAIDYLNYHGIDSMFEISGVDEEMISYCQFKRKSNG